MQFGAVLRNSISYGAVRCCDISYGAVRCGFQKSGILRGGSVRFSEIVKPTVRSVRFSDVVSSTVRFGATLCPTVRFGAVFRYHQTYGEVRCGFQEGKNPTMRCGAVNRTEPHRTDRKNRTVKNPGNSLLRNLREIPRSY